MAKPYCLLLTDITTEAVGGKAAGLRQLLQAGLSVPPAFVVLGACKNALPADVGAYYRQLGGGKVAVRSSAIGEDSAEASFAGQYDTILDVEGEAAVIAAIEQCLASLNNARAHAYQQLQGQSQGQPQEQSQKQTQDVAMVVVVQRMVDARVAGVLFTAEATSGRRNCLVIDAVAGLGEALVSGHATPDQYRVDDKGSVLYQELVGEEPLLNKQALQQLAKDARHAERVLGHPLDMEWAIDATGALYWLQARPITVLAPDPNELDCFAGARDDLYTLGNVGEVMPGATTPLSYSTTGRGLDIGVQGIQQRYGVIKDIVSDNQFFSLFYGRIFFNLSNIARTGSCVAGSNVKAVGLALCGREVPELDGGPPAPLLRRLWNSLRFFYTVLGRGRELSALEKLQQTFAISLDDDAMRLYAQIATKLPQLYEAHRYHIIVSSGAGMLEPALMQVLARQEKLDDEALHAQLAAVLAGASSGDVESADIAHGIQRIIQALLETPDAQTQFGDTKPEQALQWIASDSAGAAGESYRHYLQLHGHRAVQEFEMRQVEWEADPLPLITSIQAAYSVQRQQGNNTERNNQTKNNQQLFNSLNAGTRWLVKKTQQAVQQRERSKSLLVKITTVFKKAYRHLAQLLVDAGKLQAIDDIYFLTHQEIGALLSSSSAHPWRDMITRRRTAFAYQETLEFEQVCRGLPEPITQRHGGDFSDGVLYGKAVSRGRIEGRVRVVKTLQEATALQAGDILVTPATDIGWTPFFGVIGGLVCDIGSSVSHGAVIAREYGLPAVVNTQNATVIFQTGDTVLLDGDNGSVTLLSRAAS